jgi:thiaminase
MHIKVYSQVKQVKLCPSTVLQLPLSRNGRDHGCKEAKQNANRELPTPIHSPSTMKLTEELIQSDIQGFKKATESPFIIAAREGKVAKSILSQWLSQDKLYAEAYISFVGSLLTQITFPAESSPIGTINWRIFESLISMLQGIKLELAFFHSTADHYGLDLTTPWEGAGSIFIPNPITKAYTDLFASVSLPSCSLLEGMTLLWATEYCYLKAWQNVVKHDRKADFTKDLDGGALRAAFAPNWTTDAFSEAVATLGKLVDELAEQNPAGKNACVVIWKQILWLEERFWPHMDE